MSKIITRRSMLAGLGALVAAPAIVPASSLMPLRGVPLAGWSPEAAITILKWCQGLWVLDATEILTQFTVQEVAAAAKPGDTVILGPSGAGCVVIKAPGRVEMKPTLEANPRVIPTLLWDPRA